MQNPKFNPIFLQLSVLYEWCFGECSQCPSPNSAPPPYTLRLDSVTSASGHLRSSSLSTESPEPDRNWVRCICRWFGNGAKSSVHMKSMERKHWCLTSKTGNWTTVLTSVSGTRTERSSSCLFGNLRYCTRNRLVAAKCCKNRTVRRSHIHRYRTNWTRRQIASRTRWAGNWSDGWTTRPLDTTTNWYAACSFVLGHVAASKSALWPIGPSSCSDEPFSGFALPLRKVDMNANMQNVQTIVYKINVENYLKNHW